MSGAENLLVGFNFVSADRDQRFRLPPDMRDWLPAGHLSAFRRMYRADGHGRAAYDPAVMVALLLCAYCVGLRSSRLIERRCVEDVSFRVLAGGLCPDHVTIARFRSLHAEAFAADKTSHLVEAMKTLLDSQTGKAMMRIRCCSVEPLFGQTKHGRDHPFRPPRVSVPISLQRLKAD